MIPEQRRGHGSGVYTENKSVGIPIELCEKKKKFFDVFRGYIQKKTIGLKQISKYLELMLCLVSHGYPFVHLAV